MRKHRGDNSIIITSLLLMGLGLLVIFTIGPVRANFLNATYGSDYSENYFFIHQLISLAFAVASFVACAKFLEYKKVQKYSKYVLYVALGMCAFLALSQIAKLPLAKCELGACRWISLGGFSLQPAELVKFALVIYLASIFTTYREKGDIAKNREFWIKYCLSVGLSLFFVVVVQKDLGSGLPIAAIAIFILFNSGISYKVFAIVLAIMLACGVGAIMTSSHRRERLWTFLGMSSSESSSDDEDDAKAYHIENALIAIGTGGLFGVGFGNSVQATGYLPESINDSVFAIMGETLGFIPLLVVLGVFCLLLFRILKVADYSSDYQKSLIAIGAFAWVMTHIVVNIMSMTGITPLTGITLPLLSYGGTSMMMVTGMLGYVYQISQYTSRTAVSDLERQKEIDSNTQFTKVEYKADMNYRRRRR